MGYMAFGYIKVIISWLLWNFGDEEMFKKFCVKQMDDSTSRGRQNTRILAARRELPKITFPLASHPWILWSLNYSFLQ